MQKNPVCFWAPASHDAEASGVFTLRKARLPFLAIYIKVKDIFGRAKLIEETRARKRVEHPYETPAIE